jgi:hypothetical protein
LNQIVTMDKCEKIDSWVVALFLAESSICSSINTFISIPFISVIIMFVLLLIVMVSHKGRIRYNTDCVYMYLGISAILGISILINGREYVQQYIFYFATFGLTALVFVTLKINYKLVFINMIWIYLIVLIVYFIQGRKQLLESDNYWTIQMGIAYAYVIPVFFSFTYIILKNRFFKHFGQVYLWLAIFEVIASCYIVLFDCGTRGAVLTIILGCALIVLGTLEKGKKTILYILLIGIGGMIFSQLGNILKWIGTAFGNSDILSLRKFAQMIAEGNADNGRLPYYQDAIKFFLNSPVIGNGVGYFEKYHEGVYVHEVVLQVLCEYGVIGTSMVCCAFILFLKKLFSCSVSIEKLFMVILLCISLILFYSSTYWLLPSFWFMIFLEIMYIKRRDEKWLM